MNNQKYWEERAILKDKLLEKDINKLEKKLLKSFKDARKEVLNELKIVYADIESTEYTKYQIDNLLTSINNALDNLYSNNEKEVNKGLADIYKEMDKQASIDLNNSFNTVNENLVRETLKTNWSGLSFSERIWEHRRSLALTIKSELNKGFIRGESLQDISKIISDKFDTSFSNAMRLVRTESCWVMNEATVNNYKENGIKEYEFMAFLDSKTSKECRDLDGKKFSIEEYQAGVNLPPLHPNCRSCIVPIVEDIKKPKEVVKEDVKVDNEEYLTFTDGKKLNQFFGGEKFKDRKNSMEGIWKKQLSEDEKDVIRWYCADGYADINQYLRKYGDWEYINKDLVNEAIKDMDSAISKFSLESNISVYRAIEPSAFGGLNADFTKLIGTTYTDKAYMSTSPLLSSTAVNKDLLMQIDVPKGKGIGAYINSISGFKDEEYEFLLARGTKCEIYEISELDGKPLIKMRVI